MKAVTSVKTKVEAVSNQLTERRAQSATIDTVYAVNEHNRRLAGNLLASALAYRFFLWLLPVCLVASAVSGFLLTDSTSSLEGVGVSKYVRSVVGTAAKQAQKSRWVMLVLGLYAMYSTSKAAFRALYIIHRLVWEMPPKPPAKIWKGTLGFVGFAVLALAMAFLVQVVRARFTEFGVASLLSTFILFGGLWLGASLLLPHGDAPWTALIPGALLLSTGVVGLHLFTFLYLDQKLQSSSQLYGALGAAAAILLWLYIIGYVMVGSAVLNVARWRRRSPAPAA